MASATRFRPRRASRAICSRIGRTRPTATSPAWAAARDLPRTSCRILDFAAGGDANRGAGAEQLLRLQPPPRPDASALGADAQRNRRDAGRDPRPVPRPSTSPAHQPQEFYASVIRRDILGSWLLPALPRPLHRSATPRRLDEAGFFRVPREFMAGVGPPRPRPRPARLYSLNDHTEVAGLRYLARHTSTGRPHEMPLTEDGPPDFSRFFAIDRPYRRGPGRWGRTSRAPSLPGWGWERTVPPMVSSCAIWSACSRKGSARSDR